MIFRPIKICQLFIESLLSAESKFGERNGQLTINRNENNTKREYQTYMTKNCILSNKSILYEMELKTRTECFFYVKNVGFVLNKFFQYVFC